jgi:hypothetical protein
MIIGLFDRQAIREPEEAADDNADQQSAAASKPKRRAPRAHEFRSERWAELYAQRIDEAIAGLKRKGVPVLWVGLPAILGTKSTSDMLYLNDLYRTRAERAGIVYVDVWDGFTAESGRYSSFGPDVDGQRRRLRSPDGVFFTKYGARKLAHYVERELKRVIGTRPVPVALPGPEDPSNTLTPGAPAARPLAGPIMPLTGPSGGGELLGGGGAKTGADPLAVRVLVKGETVSAPTGRADNFSWTSGGVTSVPKTEPPAADPTISTPAAEPAPLAPAQGNAASGPAASSAPAPTDANASASEPAAKPPAAAGAVKPAARTASAPAARPAQPARAAEKPRKPPQPTQRAAEARRRSLEPPAESPPRPPAPVFDPFGFLRGDRR